MAPCQVMTSSLRKEWDTESKQRQAVLPSTEGKVYPVTHTLPVAAPSRTHSGMNFQVVPKGRSDSSWIQSRGVRLSPLQPSQGLLCPGMTGQSRKTAAWGWRNVMMVESTCCSSRGSKFSFQHPQQAFQNWLWLQIQGIQHPLLTCVDSVLTYT